MFRSELHLPEHRDHQAATEAAAVVLIVPVHVPARPAPVHVPAPVPEAEEPAAQAKTFTIPV